MSSYYFIGINSGPIIGTTGTFTGNISAPSSNLGLLVVSPVATTTYTVLASQNGTLFTELRSGAELAFTLPHPTIGQTYTFSCTGTNGLTVTTPVGSIFGAGLSGATRTLASGQATMSIYAADTSNWLVLETYGTVT